MTGRRRSPLYVVVAAAAGALLLLLAIPSIAPALRAAPGDGVPGTFVATHLRCVQHPGHELCSWYGNFRPTAGTAARTGVAMYGSNRAMFRQGNHVPAIDVGRSAQVYPPSGSHEWVVIAVLLVAGLMLLVPLARSAVRFLLVRRPGEVMRADSDGQRVVR
jgi:hypothetical protein